MAAPASSPDVPVLNTASPPTPNDAPLTISQWHAAQVAGNGLERLLALQASEVALGSNAWITLATPEHITEQWRHLQTLIPAQGGPAALPLFGVPFAAKDNIDVAGLPTTAGCPAFAAGPVARDASVVARLRAAGAILLGKTNLDQFATGLVGTRSPYGAVGNAFDPARVSGGSSSGSAVVVARGTVPFSLGTDTAGSGRVPAGFNNIVGLKPTRGALSTAGVVPACRSLDCVSILALTVDDAEAVLEAAEGHDAADSFSRHRPGEASPTAANGGRGRRMAVCAEPEWHGHEQQAAAYAGALARAEGLHWTLEPCDFSALFKLASLLYEGPWVAERYAAIKDFVEAHADEMDPTVRAIVLMARNFDAVDLFQAEYVRQDLASEISRAFTGYDAILVPTTPTFPTIADLEREPVAANALLGTYTNFVNFMDWSAVSVPAGFRDDGLPFGITLISTTWQEPRLLGLAREWLAASSPRTLGATGVMALETSHSASDPSVTPVVVVGAHLTGFPLNRDLTSRGAMLARATTTSSNYRLFSLRTEGTVRKPGLKRVERDGAAIEVEVWDMPNAHVASFLKTIPTPLGIGSVELHDGSWAHGFVCEPYGLEGATDITSYGGWRAFMAAQSPSPGPPPKRVIEAVLVANRGEIAVRIIGTLKKMGVRAISVYSEADAGAPHVHDADMAMALSGSSVSETYLDGAQMIRLATEAGADAVIPGYGFLSENADFAAAVEAAGMAWIGPTPEQMRTLGLKHLAREVAVAADVPVVPGSKTLLRSAADALAEAARIGYPVMLKSTAGGGGIGLRRCDDAAAVTEAFDGVRRLAEANFGDAGVFVEHFVRRARHVEVQILGDGGGAVVAAGERDCSLQRRNQKVVEESPAAFVPAGVRASMKKAAVRLAASVGYRNVGTVEFIYDVDSEVYYFLEVNTRLQVEHPVTESVTGLDLVEAMVRIAAGDAGELFAGKGDEGFDVTGSAVEVRVYAESPLQGFRPSSGRLTEVVFPTDIRVDTWVAPGTELSSSYDPMIAKIIATGKDRESALEKLASALDQTVIVGVETNLAYLRSIAASALFRSGDFTTSSLDTFAFDAPVVEVVDPGTQAAVQDFPGRRGLWHVGVPPSGPLDDYSFRVANRLVGNDAAAAGLELTLQGPSLLFHVDAVVAVTGAVVEVRLNGQLVESNKALAVAKGQTLVMGLATSGYRTYLAVRGGIVVPETFGSRSTFALGRLGGHNGRNLKAGDLLPLGPASDHLSLDLGVSVSAPPAPIPSQPDAVWTLAVVPGPHGAPDYFTPDGLATLFDGRWSVHYNSNRLGIRLTGPKPAWARRTGGGAGLHPSNVHDTPYSVGSVSFTGDEAVILACDGPSLGGFVVFCVVASADMWKLGQMRPGDAVCFRVVDALEALRMDTALDRAVAHLAPLQDFGESPSSAAPSPALLGDIGSEDRTILCRQAGDRAMLLDFGADDFALRTSFDIASFIDRHEHHPVPGVVELTTGVRSLHVQYEPGTPPETILPRLRAHAALASTPASLPSRILRLPIALDDAVCRAAVDRYTATIRASAPWLPSNTAFLRDLNALPSTAAVAALLLDATYLVVGLGDVFLGSPCAVPLDPRHRLLGTKYNPSRSFTPRGAVGVGGNYLCIYGMDSPGGYQLVGRTLPIWDDLLAASSSSSSSLQSPTEPKPWMFRLFDRVQFRAVPESDLDAALASPARGRDLVTVEQGTVDLAAYEEWLRENKADIDAVVAQRHRAFLAAPFLDDLLRPYEPTPGRGHGPLDGAGVEGERVRAQLPGRCWRCAVEQGDRVDVGDALLWIESNKMELKISSPVKGVVARVLVAKGDLVEPADDLVIISSE